MSNFHNQAFPVIYNRVVITPIVQGPVHCKESLQPRGSRKSRKKLLVCKLKQFYIIFKHFLTLSKEDI